MSPKSVLIFSIGLVASAPAFAHDDHAGPDHNQIQGVRGELHGNLDGYGMLGFGGRAEFAVVPNGFVSGDVHDELALSLGADLLFSPVYERSDYYYPGGPYIVPIAALQWNFYLGPRWSVFPELGIAVHASFDRNGWDNAHGRSYGWLYPSVDAGIGARYHFNDRVGLLMRASTPGGLQLGLVF